jgi:hypothetical protein
MPTESKDKPKRTRSPELQAAGAAIELAKIDASLAKAKETIAAKEAERRAILDGITGDAKVFLDRLRGTTKGV